MGSTGKRLVCVVFLALTPSSVAWAQEFSKALESTFSGAQFRGYQWLDYPLDEFGIASSYRGRSAKPDDAGFLCATYTCLGFPRPGKQDLWLRLADGVRDKEGFADVGCGGAIEASLKRSTDAMAKFSLPRIAAMLALSASAAAETASTAKVLACGCAN